MRDRRPAVVDPVPAEAAYAHFLDANRPSLSFIAAAAGDRSPNLKEQRLLARLKAERGETLYSDFLFTLTHAYYPPEQAARLWREILEHKARASDALQRAVSIVVATLDYLSTGGHLDAATAISEKSIAEIAQIAFRDGLTGLFDLATFRLHVERELARGRRYSQPVALLLLDVDNFKRINDTHGHTRGNEVLARLATVITSSVRSLDIGGRCGGDEFGVLLPGTTPEGAAAMAERIRSGVQRAFPRRSRLTLSVGAAACPRDARTAGGLWRKADEALYYSKWCGKDTVTLHTAEVREAFRMRLQRRLSAAA